jgi:3-hydroxyacyl-[acyl-carrier-protein] dehydratase
MRYLLIDRIDEIKKFQYAIGTKCISLSDDCFEHHFPGQPIFPGALLIESMAQLGGALLEISLRDILPHCPRCVLTKVTAKFRDFVKPGDTLLLKADVVSRHEDSALLQVVVSCGDKRVAEAEILYMLLAVDDPRLEASRRDFLEVLTRSTRYVE